MQAEERQRYRIPEAERPSYYRKALPSDASLFLLRVHSFEAGQPMGEVVNLYTEEIETFTGYTDALLIMDRVMDGLNFPQAATARRHLTEKTAAAEQNNVICGQQPRYQYWSYEVLRRGGKKLSVLVRVIYRQSSSWQGQLSVTGKKVIFRSALELLHLLTEAEQEVRAKES